MARAAFYGSGIIDRAGNLSEAMGFKRSARQGAGVYQLELARPVVGEASAKVHVFEPVGGSVQSKIEGSIVTLTVRPAVDARFFVAILGPEEGESAPPPGAPKSAVALVTAPKSKKG